MQQHKELRGSIADLRPQPSAWGCLLPNIRSTSNLWRDVRVCFRFSIFRLWGSHRYFGNRGRVVTRMKLHGGGSEDCCQDFGKDDRPSHVVDIGPWSHSPSFFCASSHGEPIGVKIWTPFVPAIENMHALRVLSDWGSTPSDLLLGLHLCLSRGMVGKHSISQ